MRDITRHFIRAAALGLAILAGAAAAHAAGLGALPAYYAGNLPCADCMGMRLQLNLYAGGGYMLATTYYRDGRDETFYDLGAYSVSADSSKLALQAQDSLAFQFAIQPDGSLQKLDRDGKPITSALPYALRREVGNAFEPRLTLRGNYGSLAGAATFVDCRSGLRFPVAPGSEAAELEKVFRAEVAKRDSLSVPKAKVASGGDPLPLVVQLQGRIASRPPAGMPGNTATLIVERYLTSFPSETCGARGVTHAFQGTRWVLTRLGGEPIRYGAGQREAFLSFEKGARVTGFGGCNRFTGSYVLDGASKLKLGALASTRMACAGRDLETPLLQALANVASQRITDAHLELLDAAGVVVARFEARDL